MNTKASLVSFNASDIISLSSSLNDSRISSYEDGISANFSCFSFKSLFLSERQISCTKSNGSICPFHPSCTSTSLPFFFFMTIFGSTCVTAFIPSVCISSKSPEISVNLSSNISYAPYGSINVISSNRIKILLAIISWVFGIFIVVALAIRILSKYAPKSPNLNIWFFLNCNTYLLFFIVSLIFSDFNDK